MFWDEASARWTLELASADELVADVVVSAIGMFYDLVSPTSPASTRSRAPVPLRRWNSDHDLSGETVGVIGSAASAVQFVPEIAKQAGQLHLFQRTANWVLPEGRRPLRRRAARAVPQRPDAGGERCEEDLRRPRRSGTFARIARRERAGLRNLAAVEDPESARAPHARPSWGCKRPLFSNDYYPAFNRPNLELVTDRIDRITPTGRARSTGASGGSTR